MQDNENHAVRVLVQPTTMYYSMTVSSSAATTSVLALAGGTAGYANGVASSASFSGPAGVALTASGSVAFLVSAARGA